MSTQQSYKVRNFMLKYARNTVMSVGSTGLCEPKGLLCYTLTALLDQLELRGHIMLQEVNYN